MKKDIERELTELIDASFETRYYQAIMEKQKDSLSKSEYSVYAELNRVQINKRETIRNGIIAQSKG